MNKYWRYTMLAAISLSCGGARSHHHDIFKTENKDSFFDFSVAVKLAEFMEDRDKSQSNLNFLATLEILNQTNTNITSFDIEADIVLQFKDERPMFVPIPFIDKNKTVDSNLHQRSLPVRPLLKKSEYVSSDNPWLPGKEKTFEFIIPRSENRSMSRSELLSYFQKTPQSISFACSFKGAGIGKESSTEYKLNIIEQWKRFQHYLGLRGIL